MNKLLWLFVLTLSIMKLYGQAEISKLSLNEAIEIGLKNNPELKSSFEKINAASGRFWSGISLPYPELEVSYEYIPTSQSVGNYSEKTFGFSQSIEFPTNYFLRGSKLSTAEEIAENEYKLSEIGSISKIKTAYFKALTNEEQLKIAKDNLSIAEDFYLSD